MNEGSGFMGPDFCQVWHDITLKTSSKSGKHGKNRTEQWFMGLMVIYDEHCDIFSLNVVHIPLMCHSWRLSQRFRCVSLAEITQTSEKLAVVELQTSGSKPLSRFCSCWVVEWNQSENQSEKKPFHSDVITLPKTYITVRGILSGVLVAV